MIVLLSGCATERTRPTGLTRAQLGTIGVAKVQYEPRTSLRAGVHGKAEGAAKGAGGSALACTQLLTIAPPVIGALAAIACLPVAATAGAIYGTAQAAPNLTLEQAEGRLQTAFSALGPQEAVRDQLIRYANEVGIKGFYPVDEGPTSPDASPAYKMTDGSADTVLEVAITQLVAGTSGAADLPYQFGLVARGRLIRVKDNTVLDTFAYSRTTAFHTAEEWLYDDAQTLAAELNGTYRRIAEAFIDEWFLIYHVPPSAKVKPAPKIDPSREEVVQKIELIPPHVLQPIYPKAGSYFIRQPNVFVGNLDPVKVDGLQPHFRWEALPRSPTALNLHDLAPADAVTYDIRIFRGEQRPFRGKNKVIVPQSLPALEQTGLEKPEFVPPERLESCTYYFWTVRARYRLHGDPQATEWSSANNFWSPGDRRYHNGELFLPFQTPPAGSEKCDRY